MINAIPTNKIKVKRNKTKLAKLLVFIRKDQRTFYFNGLNHNKLKYFIIQQSLFFKNIHIDIPQIDTVNINIIG